MIIAYQGSLRPAQGGYSSVWNSDDNILRALARVDSKNEYVLFNYGAGGRSQIDPQMPGPRGSNFAAYVPRLPQRIVRVFDGIGLDLRGRLLRRRGVDLLHISEQIYSVPPHFPTVVTFHDLIPELHPEWSSPENIALMRGNARRAFHFLAISEATKKDLMRVYSVSEDRITVVPNGVDLATFRQKPEGELAALRDRFRLPPRFALCVGPFSPRKNIEFVFRIYPDWKRKFPDLGLVLAGRSTDYRSRLEETARRQSLSDVIFIDSATGSELAGLYNLASFFIYPSVYEGFGLPILEAMACGCPVLAANNSSIPEVVGEAGILFSLGDPATASTAAQNLLQDRAMRDRLSHAGMSRALQFSWDETARKMARLYENLAKTLAVN